MINIIRENIPSIIYRQSDKSFRIEYEDGQSEYYSEPEKVLEVINDNIIKVNISFPSLNDHLFLKPPNSQKVV